MKVILYQNMSMIVRSWYPMEQWSTMLRMRWHSIMNLFLILFFIYIQH